MKTNEFIRNVYYLFKRIVNALKALIDELFKPTSFLKGEDFERFLRNKVFTIESYDLVMKTHDFHENKNDYVESSLYPDYLFRDKKTSEMFFVEAKYREKIYKGKVEWCKKHQLIRYKKLSKSTVVFIAIGLGGRPENPNRLFFVPLNDIEYNALYPNFLEQYEIKIKKNIFSFVIRLNAFKSKQKRGSS